MNISFVLCSLHKLGLQANNNNDFITIIGDIYDTIIIQYLLRINLHSSYYVVISVVFMA